MKLKIIVAAISFSLAACVSTIPQSTQVQSINTHLAKVSASPAVSENSSDVITLEQIMADPDWMGRSPKAWYWGTDNRTAFYQQKREGNPLRDLYQINVAGIHQGVSEKVKLAQMHVVADRNAVDNQDKTKEAYIFENNVFVKTLATGQVKQLTNTSAVKSAVMFLNNGNIAYRVGDVFYAQDLKKNQRCDLFNVKISAKSSVFIAPTTYIAI